MFKLVAMTTHRAIRALLLLALLAGPAVAQGDGGGGEAAVARGSLEGVQGRRRVVLLVSRSLVVDVRDPALVAVEDYRQALAGDPPRQHNAAARQVAQRLNKYIRKYRTVTAAQGFDDADLVLVFQVMRQHASAIPAQPHVWGKMYVLAVGPDRVPRIVWESEGDTSSVEGATDDFLKAFRAARGER